MKEQCKMKEATQFVFDWLVVHTKMSNRRSLSLWEVEKEVKDSEADWKRPTSERVYENEVLKAVVYEDKRQGFKVLRAEEPLRQHHPPIVYWAKLRKSILCLLGIRHK